MTAVGPERLVETTAEQTLRAVLRLTAALPEAPSPQHFYEVAVETAPPPSQSPHRRRSWPT
jgi:hypothetical protein